MAITVAAATLQSAAAATGNGTPLDASGYATTAFTVSGTFVGTVTFEGSNDDTTWSPLMATNTASDARATTATAPGIYRASASAIKSVRARVSAWTSGTISVDARLTSTPSGDSGGGGGGSSSLPAGASTSAKQPALGTAGTPSTDVLTVQGITNGTAQQVAGPAATGAAVAGNPLYIAGKSPTATVQPVLTDTAGNLLTSLGTGLNITDDHIDVAAIGGAAFALGQQLAAASLPTVLTALQLAALQQSDGTTQAKNLAGAVAAQNAQLVAGNYSEVSGSTTSAVAICSTDAGNYRWVSVHITAQGGSSTVTFQVSNDNTNWVSGILLPSIGGGTQGTSTTTTTGIWHGALAGRYFRLNVTGIASGTTSAVVEFSSVPSALSSVGGSVQATVASTTTGGTTTFHLVSAATTNATNVKSSAGQIYGWQIYNSNAAARKVAFHNSGSAPTAGASVLFSLVVPPTNAIQVFSDVGILFSAGIGITTVTLLPDSDATAVAANDLIINLFYK